MTKNTLFRVHDWTNKIQENKEANFISEITRVVWFTNGIRVKVRFEPNSKGTAAPWYTYNWRDCLQTKQYFRIARLFDFCRFYINNIRPRNILKLFNLFLFKTYWLRIFTMETLNGAVQLKIELVPFPKKNHLHPKT